ncbi:MAG: hypothetical protein IIY37_05555, partial [Selenomonadaceae bacterium]|nr:hypothetical protein [Selenomonadaceae bacterium]
MPNGQTVTVNTMNGGTQNVSSGGTGMIAIMSGGTQELLGSGNTGTIRIMCGGKQAIGQYDTGMISTMSNGWQEVHLNGNGTIETMSSGQSRYETGSHVKANTWGGIVAVGARNELSNGTLEWGGFVEHGSGNFTLYSETGYGSGSSNYTGGGLLAKWQNKQDVYTEASLRMGRMHDTASDILRDALGGSYGYNVHADYYGGHVGIGKI